MAACYYCGWREEWALTKRHLVASDPGTVVPRHLRIEMDHRRAKSKGGQRLDPVCGCCNARKQAKSRGEFVVFMGTDHDCRSCWLHYGLSGGKVFRDMPHWVAHKPV